MARKTKAASKEVRVIMDRPHTYQLDASRSRTLPIGWRGVVPGDVAAEIESAGHGRITEKADVEAAAADEKASGTAPAKKPATEKNTASGGAAQQTGDTGANDGGQTGAGDGAGDTSTGSGDS
ncbi:MAG: hypothetical protein CML66_25875 [Rhodobacteraceae bacterium]|nr:hypothetical protein [Paracoccaceae bacterium]MAY44647.1 hypothetical protein [Paracoccaceae bacterium]